MAILQTCIRAGAWCLLPLWFANLSAETSIRRPLGVFVKVDVETAIAGYPGSGTPTTAQLHSYFQTLLAGLLSDPAISGITVGQRWDNIQPTDANTYDWSYLDDSFSAAATAKKTVQLILTPGFDAPTWLLKQIPSCDPLFSTGSAPANCGKVTFTGFPEQQRADGNVLPLPWNSVYENAWAAFLTQLNARYGSNPLFVAFSIAGPVGASDEMIFPDDQNDSATQPSNLSVDDTWTALIAHSFPSNAAYQNTDQAFIDAWDQAIDAHEKIFSGITLFIGADAGNDFPSFSKNVTPHADNSLYTVDCANYINVNKSQLMSCEAKTEVLSYFLAASGSNGKGTQSGGMTASVSETPGDIGVAGIKVLTGLSPAPAIPFWGGSEFDYPVSSQNLQVEGCANSSGNCPGLTPEEAAYNVLTVFFYGTPAAAYYGGAVGSAPIQYLDIAYTDLQYAQANLCPPQVNAVTGNVSLQDLYNRASRDLFAMANQTKVLPPPTCASSTSAAASISLVANAEGESPIIAPNTWVEIKGTNLAPAGDIRIWQTADFIGGNLPASLDGVSVTVNGKAAYLYYISPTQINILTPPDAMTGSVQVVVNVGAAASASYTAQAQATSPSFFVVGGGPYVVAQHLPNYNLVGPPSLYSGSTTPAKPGETVVLYANGFGPTTDAVVSGSQTQSGNLSPMPIVTIGGITANVSYAALRSPGLYQFNVDVPANAPSGDNQLAATINGVATSPTFLLTVQSATPATTANFYVAPNGSDSWSGLLASPNPAGTDGPFATLDHARAAVAALNTKGLTQVTVQFRGGMYYLPATVQFTAADSGTAATPIVYTNYPTESPVFSGGMRLTGWTNTSGNTWKLTLPGSAQYFENLWYNGSRRLRPRLGSGNLGSFLRSAATVYLAASAPNCTVDIPGSGWECFDRFQYNPSDPIVTTWKNYAPAPNNPCNQPAGNPALAGDIEVLDFEQFSTSKLRIGCIDTANHIVYLTGATPISQNKPNQVGFIAGNRYLVDNVEDQLSQPGQWFLDRSATPFVLTYLANAGENPNTDTVIAPQLAQLLVAYNLSHVAFHGLTFQHDNYVVPAQGHKSSELESDIPGAVSFQNSQHITFDSGIVTQISGTGLEFISCVSAGSPNYCVATNGNATTSNDVIENSAFYDIGVLGVRIGDPYVPAFTDANEPQNMTVENNVVEGYGRTIPASFGIGQGEGHDNLYTHNEVYDGYHCAISISEQAGDTIKPAGEGNANNTISFNHVWNLLQGIMNDGGSVRIEAGNNLYTAPGNKILNNRIHDVTDASIQDPNGYGGEGIYLDNQTGLVDVENNLVYRVSSNDVFTPQGPASPNEANIVKNNILAYGRKGSVAVNWPYPYGVPSAATQVFQVSNNLFYFDRSTASSPKFYVQDGCTYSAGFPYVQFQEWSSNLYWRTDGAFAGDPKTFYVQANPVTTGGIPPCSNFPAQWTFYSFASWQATFSEDAGSIVANPGFNSPAYPADDYTLPKGSPGIGFVMFDYTQAGRSNPVLKPPAIAATFPTMYYNQATDY